LFVGPIYFAVILLSCIAGSVVGLGGGLFFRPILDAAGFHDVMNVGFFSSSAILAMTAVSTAKRIRDGMRVDLRLAPIIALGAVLGGTLGNLVLGRLLAVFPEAASPAVRYIQIAATLAVLTVSLAFTGKSGTVPRPRNPILIAGLGVLLGTVSTFLGIGGGPLNVPVFMIFFGLAIKEAIAYSLMLILVSHLSRIVTLGLAVSLQSLDLAVLPYVLTAAAVGGFVGTKLNGIFSEATVRRLFRIALCVVMLLNIVNGLFLL